MNLIVFLIAVIASFIVVRIGAVAFQLTGLEWSLAKFQALSCFSGTGFTTREAELVVGHPRRRQIASALMVLGNAGLVTLVATFANSIRPRSGLGSSPLYWVWGGWGPLVNMVIIAVALYAIFRVFTHSSVGRRLTDYLRRRVVRSGLVEPVSVEELLVSSGGYGVVGAEIRADWPMLGLTLAKSGLRQKDISVLVIRRGDDPITNPPANTRIQIGDRLICFGKLDQMRQEFGMVETETNGQERAHT